MYILYDTYVYYIILYYIILKYYIILCYIVLYYIMAYYMYIDNIHLPPSLSISLSPFLVTSRTTLRYDDPQAFDGLEHISLTRWRATVFVCSIMKSKVTANAEIVGWTWRQLFDIIWSASPLSTARCDATLCHSAKCQERRDTEQRPGILAVRPEGPLFYANIERLEAQQKYLCVAEPMWANVSHVGTCKYDKIYEDQISSFFAMSC